MEGNGNALYENPTPYYEVASERTFPLEGNGNVRVFGRFSLHILQIESERTFPLEGNGNSTYIITAYRIHVVVRKDFPVGREWKLLPPCCFPKPSEYTSERTFPLEGNGNEVLTCFLLIFWTCPKGLSRWKGMETLIADPTPITITVRKDFPVGREWKQITCSKVGTIVYCPKGLSRWKGMETDL